ncbi:MAG TPA: GAF domain-containing protein [Kofleriaceae bacterium]|nr:GAF domain-containing protein [Kofleriaceae bacterium]
MADESSGGPFDDGLARLLIDSVPTLAWTARADGWIDFYNRRWYEYTGTTPEEMEGWGWQSVHDPVELPLVLERWRSSIATGEPFEMSFPLRGADGVFRWHLTRVVPMRDAAGVIVRWFGTNTNIDAQLRTEKQLAEALAITETLNRIGSVLNTGLDLEALVQRLTDEATALCRAEFGAFFYNVINDRGESLMLYTLAGVPASAFARFPMPRNTLIFAPTFRGEGVVRIDDVTKDPRFGKMAPHYGMPKGHLPVTSYLAVPVKAGTGEVIGGLFFGHSRAAVFTARDEQLLTAVAAQAATAIENARLYEAERKARELAELGQSRTAKLAKITMSLSRALTAEQTARCIIEEIASLLSATTGSVLLTAGDGRSVDRLVFHGAHSGRQPRTIDDDRPVCETARTGTIIWVSGEEACRRYPQLRAEAQESGTITWGAIPLLFEGRTLGAIEVQFSTERPLAAEDAELMTTMGRQCGQALERARLFDAAGTARAEAENANRAKDEFLAMLGHELRNPLAPIVTALELMKLRHGTESSKEQDVIDRQVKHMTRLVDDLLDIAKITRGKVELDRRPVELKSIIAKAFEIASPLFERRGHHVTVAEPDAPVWLHADETRLSQVLANLLTNAAKYTDAGGTITVTARREARDVVIEVADNGVGIAPDMLPRVFDLFVQGYQDSDRRQGGLGIGLSLVRNLVMLHGGTVSVASEGLGHGSQFVIKLPVLDVTTPNASPEQTQGRPSALRAAGDHRRVLLVDDNRDAATLLADMLVTLGYEVVIAHDGPRALEVAHRFTPDVAILDIGLPVMDGYELAARLRALTGAPVRLLAVTGYGQSDDRSRSEQAGFECHFVKPVNVTALIDAIERRPSGGSR